MRAGSSPLARGLPPGAGDVVGRGGIIPARAGFTRRSCSSCRCRADHPRSRGVYVGKTYTFGAIIGSSPLARGLPGRPPRRAGRHGIIPARAGFTVLRAPSSGTSRDHPRSRGVYGIISLYQGRFAGSSPLARGLRPESGVALAASGIIPARAGFTRRRRRPSAEGGDHPRSRGVYTPSASGATRCEGSSPLARGLRGLHLDRRRHLGIIPARAGFTRTWRSSRQGWPDHPRSRGVYGYRLGVVVAGLGSSPLARGLRPTTPRRWRTRGGSSPLARGLRLPVLLLLRVVGIIPARAGFTEETTPGFTVTGDHPRSRGVYGVLVGPRIMVGGSSPLARGLQDITGKANLNNGIIPARAGFTGCWWAPG